MRLRHVLAGLLAALALGAKAQTLFPYYSGDSVWQGLARIHLPLAQACALARAPLDKGWLVAGAASVHAAAVHSVWSAPALMRDWQWDNHWVSL